ncbi:MAG TPA: RsmB/NOP family class I SAM-dependent RNA methyltransferase [Myxococcota bacterium]|nr:RsmB/NOP family class I SAM-dependent RNA methyltransferase [Myxococcota bacterium]
MNYQRLFNAASDCVLRFRASAFPLKNVVSDVCKMRNLNSSERRALFDLMFRFSREIYLVDEFIRNTMRFANSMSVQQKDRLALELFLAGPADLAKMATDYDRYVASLGEERYLLALGPMLCRALKADFPESASAIAKGFSSRPAKYLAIDRRHVAIEEVVEILARAGIKYFFCPMLATALGLYEQLDMKRVFGALCQHVWLMDAGSQIIAELIRPKSSDQVLDMCAGEGNKAHYITMRACHYTAMDIDQRRLNKAKLRLEGRNINFICGDARATSFKPESFDWILLDAPCSGVGTLRRNYDLVHRLHLDDITRYVNLQRQLLESAVHLLKPQGKLIYATCSWLRVENEQQIDWALKENSQIKSFALNDLVVDLPKISADALDKNTLSLFPNIHNCDGFYAAGLTK